MAKMGSSGLLSARPGCMGHPIQVGMNMENTDLPRKFLTIEETAFVLNVSTRSVRRFIARKLLRSSKALSRRVLIPSADVDAFVALTCSGESSKRPPSAFSRHHPQS